MDTLFSAKIELLEVTEIGVANAIPAIFLGILMVIAVATSSLITRSIVAGAILIWDIYLSWCYRNLFQTLISKEQANVFGERKEIND